MSNPNLIVILGAGESGVGAALLGKAKGFEIFVSDKNKIPTSYKQILESEGIEFEEGRHTKDLVFKAREIIKSPGIPDHIDLIKDLVRSGIPVISEIEFAFRYTDVPVIAITGSNGKTTTTRLTYHLFKTAGTNVAVAGNIGESFAAKLLSADAELFVIELSSFQLDGIQSFRPDIGMLLNITPDHLDRYDYKFENYANSKFRIKEYQKAGDYFLYNEDDITISSRLEKEHTESSLCSISDKMFVQNEILIEDKRFKIPYSVLKGRHNLYNAAFAIQAALIYGISKELIQEGINSFKNDPHRMEFVSDLNDVEFINDSKATNVDAVYYALDALRSPIVWIVGGVDKGNDYNQIIPLVQEKVKCIVCLGLDNQKLLDAFSNMNTPIFESKNMSEAVGLSLAQSNPGDVVLLSPACASFDLFDNYIDRGDQFRKAVLQLKK